ncbi:MAG: NAD-binding protein [Candidatus Saliniplasma sp.]
MAKILDRFTLKNRLILLTLGIVSVIILGNIGFILVKTYEGYQPTLLESMYWTIVTLSTLGSYPTGMTFTSRYGMTLTIIIVLGGVATMGIGLQIVVGPWLERTMKRALKKKKVDLPGKDHVIVCGYSEIGKEVIRNLKSHNIEFLVISNTDEKIKELSKSRIPFIEGDSTKMNTLKGANIEKALSLVAVDDDSTNAFICLTANKINEEIRIVSSVDKAQHEGILRRAGADHLVSSKSITGAMIGAKAIDASLIDIGEEGEELLEGLKIEQMNITEDSELADKTIKEADIGRKTGAAVVGIWKDGDLKVSVSPSDRLVPGNIILVLGDSEQLQSLKRYAG